MSVISFRRFVRRIYDTLTRPITEKWVGPLQASAVVRSLHLYHTLKRHVRIKEGQRILDAGSGEQAATATILARRYPSSSFTAVDLYMEGSDRGHLPLPKNIHLIQTDLFDHTPSGQYDVVICMDVLEHIENASGALDLFNRWSRKRGYLVVHVPSRAQITYLTKARASPPSGRDSRPGDEHVRDGYTIEEIRRDIETAGFHVYSERYTFAPFTWFVKEVYSLLEGLRIKGVGVVLLPFIYIATRLEISSKPRRGNGIFVIARKVA